jgi:hypothetical protein
LKRTFVTGSASFVTALLFAPVITPQASASTAEGTSLTAPHIVAHLNIAAGQQPENITLEPDGAADLTFVLRPPGGPRHLGFAGAGPGYPSRAASRDGRTSDRPCLRQWDRPRPWWVLYFLYIAGTADLKSVWRLLPGGTPDRIAALPADAVPNGRAMDNGFLYIADSAKATVWRVPVHGGTATAWSTAPELGGASCSFVFGANGLKVHGGVCLVTNSAHGSLLTMPITGSGESGPVNTVASGLGTVDDFTLPGEDDTVLIALNPANMIELIRPDGASTVVLTAAAGLQNPTAIALCGNTVYVTDAVYVTGIDPNLLTAHITR